MADAAVGKDKCGEQRLVSLPLSRIRVIMKSSPEVSSINQEALVLTAKATVSGRRGGERGGRGNQPPLGFRTHLAFDCPAGAARLIFFFLRLRATPLPVVSAPPTAPFPLSFALLSLCTITSLPSFSAPRLPRHSRRASRTRS